MLTKQQVEALIRERLAHNNSPGYGITVVDISPDARNIDIDLRFLSGRTYCCAEPGCHLPNDLARLPALADFTIRWHCIVERGARLTCNEVLRLPLEVDGYQYDYVIGESAEPDP